MAFEQPAPTEGGPDEAHPAIRPAILTTADKDLLAAAIREGMAQDPPSWTSMGWSLLVVIVIGAGLIVGYQAFQRWRPSVPLTLSADQTVTTRQITFDGGNAPVRWRVTSADTGSLLVTGPDSDTVEIDLPLPVSSCNQVATALGPAAQCAAPSSGQAPAVEFASPLSIAWTSPTPVELLPPPGTGTGYHQTPVLGVTVTSPVASGTMPAATPAAATPSTPSSSTGQQAMGTATGSAMTFLADQGSDRQRWCFDSPLSANRLQLQRGTNQTAYTFTGAEPDVECGTGLRLIVGTVGPGHQPPAITLQDVASARLEVISTEQDAQSVVGQVHLGPSGSTVLGTPTELIVHSKASAPVDAMLFQQAGSSTLSLTTPAATSVLTDNGNLVTSVWDRYQAFALPILLAIAGGLVPILLATMQGVMSIHRVRHRRPKSP